MLRGSMSIFPELNTALRLDTLLRLDSTLPGIPGFAQVLGS